MIIKDVVIYRTDRENVNGIYIPHDVLKKSIEGVEQCLGTISDDAMIEIDLNKASHKCSNFVVDDDKKEVRCDIEILNTPSGDKLKEMIDTLIPNAVSQCSMNGKTVKEHKLLYVNYSNKEYKGDK
jgi:hypothetical protein